MEINLVCFYDILNFFPDIMNTSSHPPPPVLLLLRCVLLEVVLHHLARLGLPQHRTRTHLQKRVQLLSLYFSRAIEKD